MPLTYLHILIELVNCWCQLTSVSAAVQFFLSGRQVSTVETLHWNHANEIILGT